MATRKDSSTQPLDGGRPGDRSAEFDQVNNEDNLDTRDVPSDIEEGDEDYDDEEELEDDDFDVDEDDQDDEEES